MKAVEKLNFKSEFNKEKVQSNVMKNVQDLQRKKSAEQPQTRRDFRQGKAAIFKVQLQRHIFERLTILQQYSKMALSRQFQGCLLFFRKDIVRTKSTKMQNKQHSSA